jgi:hypothetical protein
MSVSPHDLLLIPDAAAYSPLLVIPHAPAAVPADRTCEHCCHWALPLAPPYLGRRISHGAALTYTEWLVYRWHVQHHQRGVPVS